MKHVVGDIWQISTRKDVIVIPTNVGYTQAGKNPMGKGLARDAARRWPWLPKLYGEFCRANGKDTPIALPPIKANKWCRNLILFPVKPFLPGTPYLSWRQPASLELIEQHLPALELAARTWEHDSLFLVPSLGCGAGGLSEEVIIPLMDRYLLHPRFVHVRYIGDGTV